MISRRLSLSFATYLTALFGILVIATALTIAWVSDRGVVLLLEANGSANTERAARQAGAEIEGLFAPIEVGVSLMAHHRTNLATSLPIRLEGVSFFRETLLANKSAASFYIGYANGDFFLVRRLRDIAERAFFNVGAAVEYIVQSIDRDGGEIDGRYVYLDAAGRIIGEIEKPDYPNQYDPRQRIWRHQAMANDGVIRTDLYVFQTTGQVGLTFALRSPIADTVVAADLNLDTLSTIITKLKPTRGAQVILLNANEQVVAHETTSHLVAGMAGDSVRLSGLGSFPLPELRALNGKVAIASVPGEHVRYEVNGRQWLGKAAPIALRGGAPLTLLVAMPEDELLADAFAIRDRILFVSAIIFLAAVALTMLLSLSTSRKLARLSAVAQQVQRFDFSTPFSDSSSIKEIDQLGLNFEKLRGAYSSFMRMLNLIQQENDKNSLLPILLNEWAAVLNAEKAVLYTAGAVRNQLIVEAVKDGERVFIFRSHQPGLVPALVAAAVAADKAPFRKGRIDPSELSMPGLRNISNVDQADDHALVFCLRDCQNSLVGAILFLNCPQRPDGAVELVNALTRTAATWLRARQAIVLSSSKVDA